MSNQQAYLRAISGQSLTNEARVVAGFCERGIPEREINPACKCLHLSSAWQSNKLRRQVRKGEKGVKVVTFFEDKKTKQKRMKTAHVFHVSQTDPM